MYSIQASPAPGCVTNICSLNQHGYAGPNGGFLCAGFSGEDALATARKESTNHRGEQPRAEREAHWVREASTSAGGHELCEEGSQGK